jgi:cation diffusion facilitator family transporter
MHLENIGPWKHRHDYVGDANEGERRTRWVVGITLVMMVGEIAAGTVYGSMALLADGWHMGTHAAALGVAVFAYVFARKHAGDPRYTFGTGKVGALGGFASAVGLAVVALLVLGESATRLASPVTIRFDQAIGVAVLGLVVNLFCAFLLREDHDHHHEHGRARGDGDHHDHHRHGDDARDPGRAEHRDHNLRAAYLHVLADALTSVLAIAALLAGRSLGWTWMDPVMGIVGSLVIARWSWGLLRDTSAVLLDGEVDASRQREIAGAIEAHDDNRVSDLHLWRIGPRQLAAIVSVVTHGPKEPGHYRAILAAFPDLAHVTVEVNGCAEAPAGHTAQERR